MIKHVILWTLKDEYSKEQKEKILAEMKEALENLAGQIPGLFDIKVYTKGLPSSNADVMIGSSFVSEEAMKKYAVHPIHVEAANTKVRPFTASRNCLDFEV